MSSQNQKTVEAYQEKAKQYLASVDKINAMNPKKTNSLLYRLVKKNLELLPKNSKVLEVGSANGDLSLYIQKLGYNVTASDVADDFIDEILKNGLRPIRFNLLEDKLSKKYHCVICWKVFVHFTEEDIFKAMTKIYDSLEKSGILIFNVISDETKNTKEEWIDFPNEYSIGVDRYFRYYSKKEIDDIIANTSFQILDFHKEIGVEKQQWLIYVLKKESK